MNIVLLGAPGAGKGTQAEIICEKLNIPTISTGNILRAAIKDGTELGKKAKSFIDAGDLVPDDVIIGIIKDRLSEDDAKNGFVLDGVPRTINQASAIDEMGIRIDKAVDIVVNDEDIITRISGRRACACGASYHIVYKKPKIEGICDVCGKNLIIRDDDKPETVKARLENYNNLTAPLKGYYTNQGKYVSVNGTGAVSEITDAILKVLGV